MNTQSESLNIPRLDAAAKDFHSLLARHLKRGLSADAAVHDTVAEIIGAVRERGDEALLEYSRRLDGMQGDSIHALSIGPDQLQQALNGITPAQKNALQHAAGRIRRYHEKQKQTSWQYEEADGSVYGQQVTPLQRVGIYVPGGKADYPSSMLMLAIPAQVAGVEEVIATVPTPYAADNMVFAAAALAGVKRVFTVGGAQAIAALAYGTESVPRVDKIAGPGNTYVTAAKRQVFGHVGIDMPAGPTELTVISDGSAPPHWLALDMFSQAEHDEQAQSILIATSVAAIDAVEAEIHRLLPTMERRRIIQASLVGRGFFVLARDLKEATVVSDCIAPEHLQLAVAEPQPLLPHIRHAGAIFLGHYSAEALGDYCAGPSHVLPTAGSARFCSALGVYDFQKRTSLIQCSARGAHELAPVTAELARGERLPAHALAAECRRSSAAFDQSS